MKINFLLLLILLFFSIKCNNKIFPPIGGDIINPYIKVNNNNKKYLEKKPIIVSNNYSFQINTTNMNEKCTPECYLNCQTHFIDVIQEKYCIINVCNCEIINENNNILQNNLKFLIEIDNNNKNNNNNNEIKYYNNNWIFSLILIFILYEYFTLSFIINNNNNKKYINFNNNLNQILIPNKNKEYEI